MRPFARRFLPAVALVFAWPLATANAQSQAVRDSGAVPAQKPSADLIVLEQLRSRTFPNAYAAIEALRGNWLRQRNMNPATGAVINPQTGSASGGSGSASPTQQNMPRDVSGIQVYIDGTRAGGIEALRAIPISSVYSIRRISGTNAQARFGIGHSDGVIFVATGPDKGGG